MDSLLMINKLVKLANHIFFIFNLRG